MVSIASRYIEARRDPVSLTPHTEESIKTDANTEEPHRNIVLQGRDNRVARDHGGFFLQ